jgi:hypothetical protein
VVDDALHHRGGLALAVDRRVDLHEDRRWTMDGAVLERDGAAA